MKRHGFLFGSIILMASAMIAKILGAFFRIPLTDLLGGTGMGYFSSAYALFLPIFALSVTGMNTAVSALTAEAAANQQPEYQHAIRNNALLLFGSFGLVGSVILYFGADPVCTHLLQNPLASDAVKALSPTVFFCCLSAVWRGVWEGSCFMLPTAVSQALESMIRLFCGLWFCYSVLSHGGSLQQAAAAAIFGVTISTAIGFLSLLCWKKTKAQLPASAVSTTISHKAIRKQLLRLLIPVSFSALVTNMTSLIDLTTVMRCMIALITRSPQTFGLLSAPSPADAIAIANFLYGAFSGLAVTVFNLVPSVTNMLGKSVLPAFASAYAKKDTAQMYTHAVAAIRMTAILAIPAGLGVFTLAEPILLFLFPSRPEEIAIAASPLMILGLAMIFLAISVPIFSMLQAAGSAMEPVRIMLWGIAVKLPCNLLLMQSPSIHLCGAAIATLLCYLVIVIRAVLILRRKTAVSLPMVSICLPPTIGGIGCALTAWYLYHHVSGLGHTALLLAIAGGGIVYLCILRCFGIHRLMASKHANAESASH